MKEDIKICAVIPTWNRAETIARSIESVLSQTYSAAEVIIVDDGSKDNTRQIVQAYNNKVRYLYQENMGVSAARNSGVNQTTSEWIAFLDSDDYWFNDHLKQIAEAIKATKHAAVLYFSDAMRIDYEKKSSHWQLCKFKVSEPFEIEHVGGRWVLMRIQPMLIPTSVMKRSALLEIGGFAKHLRTREDTHLFLKLGLCYSLCAVKGIGGAIMSDSKTQLTEIYGEESECYSEATVSMYRDLLVSGCRISTGDRVLLSNSLSASFFSNGQILYRKKKYFSSIRNLVMSGCISPLVFGKCCTKTLGRRVLNLKTRFVDRF